MAAIQEKKVTWLELFFDLVFVTAVSFSTRLLVEVDHHPELLWRYFAEYLLMVFPMFWLWTGQTLFMNRFGDVLPRPELFMLPQMFCFIVMTASLDFVFAHTYHTWLGSYLGLRLLTVAQYHLASRRLAGAEKTAALLLRNLFLPGLLIAASSPLFSEENRYAVMYFGIGLDMLLPLLKGRGLAGAPVNLPHLAERFGLFVLITFGESLVSITSILVGHTGDSAVLAASLLGFVIISSMWFYYFFAYEKLMNHHKNTNGQVLIYCHFFILIAIMLLAGAFELLEKGHLQPGVVVALFYGPILLFFFARNIIFYFHHKSNYDRFRSRLFLSIGLWSLAVALNMFFCLSAMVNLVLLAGVCLAEAALQSRGLPGFAGSG